MGEIWLLTLQIALLAFLISMATAALIWGTRQILRAFRKKESKEGKK